MKVKESPFPYADPQLVSFMPETVRLQVNWYRVAGLNVIGSGGHPLARID
jgi:hypothetical protein